MLNQVQHRISKLELSINLLEEHLRKFRQQIKPGPFKFIKHEVENMKRELQIRRDYPI
ncbi:MAG: hypothetical protein ACFFC3_14385 [Candidatus Odinarchaeota archaeon]